MCDARMTMYLSFAYCQMSLANFIYAGSVHLLFCLHTLLQLYYQSLRVSDFLLHDLLIFLKLSSSLKFACNLCAVSFHFLPRIRRRWWSCLLLLITHLMRLHISILNLSVLILFLTPGNWVIHQVNVNIGLGRSKVQSVWIVFGRVAFPIIEVINTNVFSFSNDLMCIKSYTTVRHAFSAANNVRFVSSLFSLFQLDKTFSRVDHQPAKFVPSIRDNATFSLVLRPKNRNNFAVSVMFLLHAT